MLSNEYSNIILGTFVPSRLHINLNDLELVPGSPQYCATKFHEYWHYLQTCLTGYGQRTWNIYRQSTGFVFREFVDYVNENKKKFKIPFGYFGNENIKDAVMANLWFQTFYYSVGEAQAKSKVSEHFKYLSDLDFILCKEKWQINPTVLIDDKQYILQGDDVIEGQAFYMEQLYNLFINDFQVDLLMQSSVPDTYSICLRYFLEQLGEERIQEFPVLCDLALQAYWNLPINSEEEWQESHPAWRFIRLIDEAKEVDIHLNKNNISDNYEAYCGQLLIKCGYLPLQKVLLKAEEFYAGRSLLRIEEEMLKALRFRQENLISGAMPFLETDMFNKLLELRPSSIQEGGELSVFLNDNDLIEYNNGYNIEGRFLEVNAEIHLQAFVCQMLGRKNCDCGINQICCGYKYYNLNGCYYQKSGECDGILTSKEKMPIGFSIIDGETFAGCFFEAMLYAHGLSFKDIDINFSYNLQTLKELEYILKEKPDC